MPVYEFESIGRFKDRTEELVAIDEWFERQDDPHALLLHGRRRVGKSWLFRAFAHRREADIFVASTRALGDQLSGFASMLEREGERPALTDLESFFRLLYRRARQERRLAVIDELPNLVKVDRELPGTLLKVMEEEAAQSHLKLVFTGSHVSMMEEILAERQPLHDRLQGLPVRPLDFWRARLVLGEADPERQLVAYGLAGGMPKYLAAIAGADDPVARLAELALSPLGRLFNEARTVLAQELDSPATHFSLLAALAAGPADYATIEKRSRVEHGKIGRYLATLQSLHLVTPRFPVTDPERRSHSRLYVLADGFLRFWFRYVFPFEADLEAGLDPAVILENEIAPTLSDHLASTVEEVAREWVRRHRVGNATRVGAWWGPSLDELRRTGERTNEEIDIVGLRGSRAVVVGEVRWRSDPMTVGILGEITRFKLPALAQAGVDVHNPQIILVSRSGFTPGLLEAADKDRRITLVDVPTLASG
jgi:AAA+ ATPase superfamily predicted ATPase